MPPYEIVYKASPTLSKFHQDNAFYRGIMGPFGSGKSVGMCMEIMKRAREMPPCRDGTRRSKWSVVRNTYRELHDSTIQTWLDWFPENYFGYFHKNDMTHYVRFDDVELDVVFRALDKPGDVRKLLSTEYSGAWLNEAREIPKAILDALPSRVTRFPRRNELTAKPWFGVIMDTNPPDTDHWWFQLSEEPERFVDYDSPVSPEKQIELLKQMYHFYKQPSGLADGSDDFHGQLAENIENLDPEYYTRMMIGKSAEWVKVYIHGDYGFIIDGKPVFPEYVDKIHCTEFAGATHGLEIIRGWDFGLTPTCVFLQVTPRGQVLVFDELSAEEMGVDRFSDTVINYCQTRYQGFRFVDYGDPAGHQRAPTDEKTCFQILTTKGIEIQPGRQELALRLESVRKVLNSMVDGKPGIQIHPKCKLLRRGFLGGYQRRRVQATGTEKFTDLPDKNQFSHSHDALQYALTMITGLSLIGMSLDSDEMYLDEEERQIRYMKRKGRSKVTGY